MIDWDAVARGWQATAAAQAGVDLASLYRRVTRLGRDGGAPRDADAELTHDDIVHAAQKALEKCSRENSKWTRADLVANLGRVLPRRPADPDGQAALLEEMADRALAGSSARWPAWRHRRRSRCLPRCAGPMDAACTGGMAGSSMRPGSRSAARNGWWPRRVLGAPRR